MNIRIRNGNYLDSKWLYDLYCSTMKTYVEETWGWDEEFQRNGFIKKLPPEKFCIIAKNGADIGAYFIIYNDDHLKLEMLIVDPGEQNQGIGTFIMKMLQRESKEANTPLRLNIIKVNPVKSFYLELGFLVYEEDKELIKMEWNHSQTINSDY